LLEDEFANNISKKTNHLAVFFFFFFGQNPSSIFELEPIIHVGILSVQVKNMTYYLHEVHGQVKHMIFYSHTKYKARVNNQCKKVTFEVDDLAWVIFTHVWFHVT
jgi:hypothetical protein